MMMMMTIMMTMMMIDDDAAHARTRKAAQQSSDALEMGCCFKFILINSSAKPALVCQSKDVNAPRICISTWLLGLVV